MGRRALLLLLRRVLAALGGIAGSGTEVSIACPGQKAQCPGHSQCREAWELCDVHGDCGDGLNEARCSPNCCLEGQWQCRNQVYVVDSWRCDGVNDCGDSSDEDACGHQLYNSTSCRVTGEFRDPKQSLALALSLAVLVWVNRGKKGKRTIEAAGMDCSDQKVLAAVHMEEPVGLTLDYVAGRLYWISEYKEVLERELKLVFSSGKRLYLLKVGFMGTAIERTLVQEHPRNIYLLDIDWKRNLIYWTNAQGQLFCSTGYSGEKREIWTEHTGLQSLSLLKNRTYTLNKTWSDGIIAAHEPYLVTVHRGALLLWDRRMLEPFMVSKEPNQCIEEKYHCDGAQQCSDGSDELGCWKPTEDCSLRCDNKTRFHVECSSPEFRCENGQCISNSLRCDGNRDCVDHSDEDGCPGASPLQCPLGEVKCQGSGECVPAAWLCDRDFDCEDGTDEQDCDPEELRCGPRQWSYAGGDQCVSGVWRCDGQRDCEDGSDKAGCPPAKCQSSEFQCRSHGCLALRLACDGKEDCADGSDEGGTCSPSACRRARCPHACYQSPHGSVCACEQAFELGSSGQVCKDVDECEKPGSQPCSQTHVNTQGSYSCTCHPGYSLGPDGHTYKATGTELILLVALQFNLLLYGLRSLKEDILATVDKNVMIFSNDYDLVGQKVFWTDLDAGSIKWISMDTKKKGTVVKGIKSDCIAVDWIGRNLYWVDGTAGQILAVQLTAVWRGKSEHTIVLDDDLTQLRFLASDPLNGLIYWSEIGGEPQIGQAGMDGSSRKILVSQGLGWPTSLALDRLSWQIFWSDDKFHCIGSAHLDGTGVRMLQLTQIKRPFSVAVFEDEVFWSEMKTRTVQRMKKTTGKNRAVLIKRSQQPHGLKIYLKNLEALLGQPTLPEHRILPFTNVKQLASLDYIVQEKALYLSELDNGDIRLLRLKESGKLSWRKIIPVEGTVIGLAVDWLSGNIYWIDSENPHINVASSKGQYPTVLVSENLYRPTSVALHPPSAVMCFVDLGAQDDGRRGSSIECASMDGSRRKVLWQKSQVPEGLTFSDSGTRVYWADTGRGLRESIQQDGSRYRVDRRGIEGLTLFTFGQGMMFWMTIDDVWYSKAELSENQWFQIDQKIVDLKVYSKLRQQGTYPDKTHSTPTSKNAEAGKRSTTKAALPLQATKSTKARYPGPEGMSYPVRKTLIPPIPARESKTPETKEKGELVQPKDSQRAKHLPCSTDFCNGRGICTMVGELRKCRCPMEYGGEFCEEPAHGPAPGYIALSLTIVLPVVLVALGAFVCFRREHKLKRNSASASKNSTRHKENGQEEENLMNSETLVNEVYDEQMKQ
ncbi:hypothetical protein GH733_005503 [Mirounga leonina]|nr:hypothetical protein GH733_005503 [Mirounga leonina]